MLSRLATVLHELSGEEAPDGGPQEELVPQLHPGKGQAPLESEVPEEAMERLAHLEQLQELIRDKDRQLALKDTELNHKDAQLQNERESAEARFTKLKLQAKAKMASLTKQINDMKGQVGATQSPDSSFTAAGTEVEEELQLLKTKLSHEEASSRILQESLQAAQHLLQEKETAHAEQLGVLQAVVCEKDVRFQEQIQKHEEELLRVTAHSQSDAELQQALHLSQRRCEELEEAVHSRSQVLEMLQQEVTSADQQKQILTTQFRQMEQELAEAGKQFRQMEQELAEAGKQRGEERQQWAQQASEADAELVALRASREVWKTEKLELSRLERELASLRAAEQEALGASQEALEKEHMEVARLLRELASVKEAELATIQASHDSSERDRTEIDRLERELSMKEATIAAFHANQETFESERLEFARCQKELAELRQEQRECQEQGESQEQGEILGEVWRHLCSLASDSVHAAEESYIPTDPSVLLDTLQALEARLTTLKQERNASEERCDQVTHTVETLQEQLDRRTSDQEEADVKIQQLEQQIQLMSCEPVIQKTNEPSAPDLSEDENAHIQALEKQLLDKDNELTALRECLALAKEQNIRVISAESCDHTPVPGNDAMEASSCSPTGEQDLMEDTPEEETTLVAQDTSVFSVSADNESSPELIGPQSDSPVESKGASSDEMVTSSDSEVAHSSWTLLEAVAQDGSQEWPPIPQDYGQLQLQSWEATSVEQDTSTVHIESSSVIIRETVQVQVTQQVGSTIDSALTSGQVFAQALAEELQKRYSELMAELQGLRQASIESQEKILSMEEERQSLVNAKEEAESQVRNFEEELQSAREELYKQSQLDSTAKEKYTVEMCLLEEQITILQAASENKEDKIQTLLTDFEDVKQALSQQEAQARMLNVQLEDRVQFSSELERKLQDMENSLLEYSQTTDLNNASLSEKDSEINELQLRMTQKEQEMFELSDSMSAKLLQVGEEKFVMSSEVKKLKEQITELEKVREEKQKVDDEGSVAAADDELGNLRREKEELETQFANMKKKLQVALVQRKELMKKVANLEEETKKCKEQDGTATVEPPRSLTVAENKREQDIQEMEAVLNEVKQALRSKEEAIKTLEQRIVQQDEVLADTVALNTKLCEEAERSLQAGNSAETSELQSQVASLETDCETLQKKLLEAQESRKETIRKAKEKDRHHREQLKQQKEEYNELLGRFEGQSSEREVLLTKLKDLEELQIQNSTSAEDKGLLCQEDKASTVAQEKPAAGYWGQEDWVDFAAPESDLSQPQREEPIQHSEEQPKVSLEMESQQTLKEECKALRLVQSELEEQLQTTHATLSLRESDLSELGREIEALRGREKQIEVLSEETRALREKCIQAESYAETIRIEVEAAVKTASESSIITLQAEVEEFKLFLSSKNQEIMELSQQLSDQSSLLCAMQGTVSEKDQLIDSLQEELKAEHEKNQRLETEVPQKQEEIKDSEAKIQQLQRKLQAALISRKEARKENQTQKEELASTEKVMAELQANMKAKEAELEKLQAERVRLIEEVDRTLMENQSLGSSCESLKLAMEAVLTEKDACKREVEYAKEESTRTCRDWEEKVQGMKDEYETLLKSYENVSDEAERVRRVLEAARQERQELAARVRTHETARQEAERQVEEARKEVDSVKDKMRKFARTKQQKIMELEEENERLRELEEKKGLKREDRALNAELKRLQEELGALKVNFDAVKAERDSSAQKVVELTEQRTPEGEEGHIPVTCLNSGAIVEESVVSQELHTVMAETAQEEAIGSRSEDEHQLETKGKTSNEEVAVVADAVIHPTSVEQIVQVVTTESAQDLLENKIRAIEATVGTERELRQEQEAQLKAEVASLEQQLQESKEKEQSLSASLQQSLQEIKVKEQSLTEEASKREDQLKELRSSLEAEKDDLEECLMNQLAQLNGSIAGYQQEAADTRERLADLQRDVERLEKERAELEAQAQSEMDRAARLEEDKRQAQRERAEAEAESGKQRELEQQLRSAQRVKEGSQSRARQLEELLREKQLEMRQLQKDSIHYQERISELSRESKTLQLGHEDLQKQLDHSHLETSKMREQIGRAEDGLLNCKSQLNEAQKQIRESLAEKMASEQTTLQREAAIKSEAEQTLDSVRFRLGAELKQMELRLEEAYRDREKEEEAAQEARGMAAGAEGQVQEMQARLDESLARLAAFSRCMSSLQDDRDRVLDETRQWETRFNSAIQGKVAEVREAETRAKELAAQLQGETALKEELQLSVDRLQNADTEWQLRLEGENKKVRESQAALEQERERLQQTSTQLQSTQAEFSALESESEGLRHRALALEEAVVRLKAEVDQVRLELREREAEERRLCLNVERLETDLRSSKALTESLQTELSEKERREVELLGQKEQDVAQAAEEARREANGRAEEAETALEQRRAELREAKDQLHKAQEESSSGKARLDSFTKAMGSLQDDRDRMLHMYKQLEEKHLQVMMEKDGLIQEAAGENNSLKEELRSLLVQRDDLYAEKGKLAAQLHGYREELNQVLSMKESQHKRLLTAQRERIASLEKERQELETQIQSQGRDGETEVQAMVPRVERETPTQAGDGGRAAEVSEAPGAEMEKLLEQLQASKERAESLEESLLRAKQEQDARAKEVAELRWEDGVMRMESESAQERVAELARDLMVVEQKLLEEKEVSAQLRTENQSFGNAMASLQDSRDQAVLKAQELGLRLDELNNAAGPTAPSSPGGSTGEVWGLKNALQALQNDRERLLEQLQKGNAELQRQKSELSRLGAGELIKVSQELFDERRKAEELLGVIQQLEDLVETGKQETETHRLERMDWVAQAEQLKQQTLVTLSERDQQLRQLATMLEEARAAKPKILRESYQRTGTEEVDGAPGAPGERSSLSESPDLKELQRRLEEEMGQRMATEELLVVARDQLKRHTQGEWLSAREAQHSETAVLIDPPEGAVSRTRRSGAGLARMLRVAFCSRQRTPLLFSIYLLAVHVLLLLCLGGYL